ncbi:MAG: hypothetical protein N3B16_04930, partial [Candidatus Aminicenantes bacterium]|nr:hypothetical protein [Candidatus Aminicenantes bacterium]
TGERPFGRWEKAVESGRSRLKPLLETDLDVVFSLHYPRKIKKDGSFSFQGSLYKLKYPVGDSIGVAFIPDKKLMVLKNGQKVAEFLV